MRGIYDYDAFCQGTYDQNCAHKQFAHRIRLQFLADHLKENVHRAQHIAVKVTVDDEPPRNHPDIICKQMIDATRDLCKAVNKNQLV